MFKNPLKYQQGGQLNEQQQQMLAAFIDWLPKRVKEFRGMQPDAIVQALDGMSKTPEGQKQVQQLMEQFQQESQSVQSAKHGGKIQDFICKHGRGGAVAGCGCEKPVLKGQEAIPGGMPRFQAPTNYYNEKGWPISERDAVRRNNRTFYTEEPTTAGNLAWTNNQMSSQLMWPGVVQDVQYNLPVGHYIDEYGNMHNFAVQGEDLTRYNNRKAQWKGDGGKVEKAQWGGITTGNERTNANKRGQYWEDLTINPEFGRTYRLTLPGWGINEKMIRHEGPNGTIIKSRYSLMSEPSVRWVNVTTPNSDDYEWKNFYSNHMKNNIPQRLSNAQRLVPPMYDVKK